MILPLVLSTSCVHVLVPELHSIPRTLHPLLILVDTPLPHHSSLLLGIVTSCLDRGVHIAAREYHSWELFQANRDGVIQIAVND